jgi:hypothetical protein
MQLLKKNYIFSIITTFDPKRVENVEFQNAKPDGALSNR